MSLPFRALGILVASTSSIGSADALAQDSQTASAGERYDYQETFEYGAGSTIYNTNTIGEINGQQVDLQIPDGFRYFIPFTLDEIAQTLPENFQYDVGGSLVTVTDWQSPEWIDGWYETTDSFISESYHSDISDIVTVQVTYGAGPDALVPTGYVGICNDDGRSGPTNFGAMDGAFAVCETAEDYFLVAPDAYNTHTHTTAVYTDHYYRFESYDDAYYDFYVARPASSLSSSTGTLTLQRATSATLRSDSYQVRLTGRVNGADLFSEIVPGEISSGEVQARLDGLSAPTAYVQANSPAVVVWSDPVLTEPIASLVESSAQTSVGTSFFDVVTLTTTYGTGAGEEVIIGTRGECSATGISGTTNGPNPTGTVADCADGLSYLLSSGEINNHTHITAVTLESTDTVITETWLNTQDIRLAGTPVPIGPIHAAIRDALLGQAGALSATQTDRLAQAGPKLSLWADWEAGRGSTESGNTGLGSKRRTQAAIGGISIAPAPGVRLALSAGQGTTSTRLLSLPEAADVDIFHAGSAAQFDLGAWLVRVSAGHGWADVSTTRGSAELGGIARANYHGNVWLVSFEAGPQLRMGIITLRPYAAGEWSSARLGAFTEAGGIAIGGLSHTANRTAVSSGISGSAGWTLPEGARFGLSNDLSVGRVIDGQERMRPVHFAAMPGTSLQVASADENRTFGTLRTVAFLILPNGLGLRLGGEASTGSGQDGWRAFAGISAGF